MQLFFQRSVENNSVQISKDIIPAAALPLPSFRRLLQNLHSWISKLHPADTKKTVWQDYTKTHSYSSAEAESKRRFVAEFVTKEKPKSIWDLGCNTGDYCITALESGAEYAVGFDYDQGALELAFARSEEQKLAFQPLFFDAVNPSPNQGWREQERYSLQARASADAVIALAFIHHLAISHNIPLNQLLDWIIALAPRGVIEFVRKSDPMAQILLRRREDIFPDYTKEAFLNYLSRSAKITHTETVSSTGRFLLAYERQHDS
jgi:ribosomal protein L11 methylase PrmA